MEESFDTRKRLLLDGALIKFVHTVNTPRKADVAVALLTDHESIAAESVDALEYDLVERSIAEVGMATGDPESVPAALLADLARMIGSPENAKLAAYAIFHRDASGLSREAEPDGIVDFDHMVSIANVVHGFYEALEGEKEDGNE